jgi:RNA polymerase sigma-70 factor (ECF subfamily)
VTTNATLSGALRAEAPSDDDLVSRIRGGDTALFEILMRRYNQRLFRIARGIVRERADAEDVLQQAYLNAFTHLHQYERRGAFAAWLARIAVREALAGHRRRSAAIRTAATGRDGECARLAAGGPDPEQAVLSGELQRDLQAMVDDLDVTYRPVFVLREVEGLSTAETADALGLSEDVVKTRLHRARAMLQAALARDGRRPEELLRFGREQCDGVVAAVLARLQETATGAVSGAKARLSPSAIS